MIILKPRLCLAEIEDFSIIEVSWLLVTWKMADKLLISMWNNFLMSAKKFGCWIFSKKESTTICVKNWTHVGNTKKKLSPLIWKWAKTNKNELV